MKDQHPGKVNRALLALPEGERPGMAWSNILLRTHGIGPIEFSFGASGGHVREWAHRDLRDPSDIYRYTTREPDIRWVGIDYYAGWFRRGKEWYPDIEDWIDAKSKIRDFHQLDLLLLDRYRQRHYGGGKKYIDLARKSMEVAPEQLDGFKRDHKHQLEFDRSSKGPFAQYLHDRYGINIDPATLPDRPVPLMSIPVHRGMKQLTIILDKTDRHDEAIAVCREAIQIEWPGDWEARISRYAKRIDRMTRASAANTSKVPRTAIHRFCTQCGEPLNQADMYCGSCGNKRH